MAAKIRKTPGKPPGKALGKPQGKPAAGLLASLSATERQFLLWIGTGLLVGLGLLGAAMSAGRAWLDGGDAFGGDPSRPHWLMLDAVRATTAKGESVRARVALDAPDADTREWIGSQPRQLTLLMQVSVAEYDPGDATGSKRVKQLGAQMQERLNDFLAAREVPPVRSVMVQDLVYSTP